VGENPGAVRERDPKNGKVGPIEISFDLKALGKKPGNLRRKGESFPKH